MKENRKGNRRKQVAAIKIARRADWEARDWVAVAAAAFVVLAATSLGSQER